jgi:hypothetical protein
MSDADHANRSLAIIDGIDDPVVSLPHSVLFPAGELLRTRSPRVIGQSPDPVHDPFEVFLGEGFEVFGGGRLDEDAIAVHDA